MKVSSGFTKALDSQKASDDAASCGRGHPAINLGRYSKPVAIKALAYDEDSESHDPRKEVGMLAKFKHRNVVRMFDWFYGEMKTGSQICDGLTNVHGQHVVHHRDLKPASADSVVKGVHLAVTRPQAADDHGNSAHARAGCPPSFRREFIDNMPRYTAKKNKTASRDQDFYYDVAVSSRNHNPFPRIAPIITKI
ncbi:hypothetical protein HDU87_007142 [Geranomyces variabilis]|uniref:Protein kinase domain-containing protein n=1 Tax=Geranomyces variabilis TaxID=109894 RepID=A0AAD5XQ07_9FUNG|nr:hypothetical protein HDU87_007142 [Geranomyces variabilis]